MSEDNANMQESNEVETSQVSSADEIKVAKQEEVAPKTQSDAGEAPKVMPIISIGVVEGTNELAVSGQIHNKRICLNALADAIKIVTNITAQNQPGVIVPKDKGGIITPGA